MAGVKGRSGARQKSAAKRKLDGSRKRPHHYAQAAPPTPDAGEPTCPDWLDDALERDAWARLAGQLRLQKRLTLDTGPWLLSAATAEADFMRWREEAAAVSRIVYELGDPEVGVAAGPKVHPAHQQYRLARKAWLDILKEGGLTPASVVRVKMPDAPDEETVDPFTAIDAKRDARAQIRRVK